MKTVKQIIEDLSKFPSDANVYGYEGEAVGIGIIYKPDGIKPKYGFIHCSERNLKEEPPTEFLLE